VGADALDPGTMLAAIVHAVPCHRTDVDNAPFNWQVELNVVKHLTGHELGAQVTAVTGDDAISTQYAQSGHQIGAGFGAQ
jgi:hypothetical protein